MTIDASTDKRIVLLAAGIGSRLGAVTEHRNKGLLSINNKAILSYILESLPPEIPTVVALGHFAEQVRSFLEIAYPERKFFFHEVAPYQGPGSSSGYSLQSLRPLVPGPFIFCTNDTIARQPIRFEGRNWIGLGISDDIEKYTTASIFGSKVTQIYRKGELGGALAYIGLSEIHDYEAFWGSLDSALGAEHEGSDIEGLFGLLPHGLYAKQCQWIDTGSRDRLEDAQKILGAGAHLPKADEDLYFQNGRVIKFFSDAKKSTRRVERARTLGDLVPHIDSARGNFYAYKWVEGEMLSTVLSPQLLGTFLEWAKTRLWQKPTVLPSFDPERTCRSFYFAKTIERLSALHRSGYVEDARYTVNGTPCERALALVESISSSFYKTGVFASFHGDLHPDNILVTNRGGGFVLLDWRDSFDGLIEVGDVYYDLAKIYHGLLVSHDFVKANQFSVVVEDSNVSVDIPVHYRNIEAIETLESWTEANGFSVSRLRLLTSLIYLNIAPLHHYPYNQFLFFWGLRMLQRATSAADNPGA